MNEQEFERFGEQIKRQGENQGGTMTQLVYNPDTGEFEQVAKGAPLRPASLCRTEFDNLVQLSDGSLLGLFLCQRQTDIV